MAQPVSMYDRVLALVEANDNFWTSMGAHTLKHSPLGIRLAAFFREVWHPWYTRVILIAAHELTDEQTAKFVENVADQLIRIRDDAGYRYQLSSVYENDQDGQLAELAADAHDVVEALALGHHVDRKVMARRGPPVHR